MDQGFKKKLLLEYSKIMLKGLNEYDLPDAEKQRLCEIRTTLSLKHDEVMSELQKYVTGTVTE